MSNHLQMSLQRQHILLSYFKTLSVGSVWGSNPRPPALTELTGLNLSTEDVLSDYFLVYPQTSNESRRNKCINVPQNDEIQENLFSG